MFRIFFTTFIILLFISNFGNAQTSLLQVDISKDVENLEGLELKLYHRSENSILIEADATLKSYLQNLKIPFTIIDKNPSQKRYFISDAGTNVLTNARILTIIDGYSIIEDNNPEFNNFRFPELKRRTIKFNTAKEIANNLFYSDSTQISALLQLIQTDSVRKYIQGLQDLKTRFLFSSSRDSVAIWIKNQFINMGYTDVVIDSFNVYQTWQKNVVATLPSLTNNDEEIIVGAHHDSYSGNSDPYLFAPGADDNASGTSAVLEIARVLRKANYRPSCTIRFVTFAAEEYGLYGSKDYADKAKNSNANIKLMINHDMISYSPQIVSNSFVNVNYYSGYKNYSSLAENILLKYTQLKFGGAPVGNSPSSDSYSFANQNYPAIYFEEGVFSPFYHSSNDVISNYNIPYCTEVIKASCATLLNVDQIPKDIRNVKIFDEGTGNSLLASWDSTAENYKVYVGKESGKYDSIFQTYGNSFHIKNLTAGVRYYIGVSSLNNSGYEGFITETSFIPTQVPSIPQSFTDLPNKSQINLQWRKNAELDIAGYNLYRSEGVDGIPIKLNAVVETDTFYIDNNIKSSGYYYYFLKAIDNSGLESEAAKIRSRIINLDQGILLVDETSDGDGTQQPSDEQVDEFFSDILTEYNHQNFDLKTENEIKLADLGAFSTIIWCGNDFYDLSKLNEINSDLKKYLDMGGNFIYNGYFPGRAISGNTSLSMQYKQGSFLYDYFRIASAEKKFGTRFFGAVSDQYNSIFVDTSKVNSLDDHLTNIEVLEAAPGAEDIFFYYSKYDTSDIKGGLKGRSVGVQNLTGSAKTLVLSFPLYYMNRTQSQSFINDCLSRFNEVSPVIEKNPSSISDYKLLQNFPNPFNPATTIVFELPEDGNISIKLYDVIGREVLTLVNEFRNTGRHTINLDASHLSSGVYYYQLKAGKQILSKKLLLLK